MKTVLCRRVMLCGHTDSPLSRFIASTMAGWWWQNRIAASGVPGTSVILSSLVVKGHWFSTGQCICMPKRMTVQNLVAVIPPYYRTVREKEARREVMDQPWPVQTITMILRWVFCHKPDSSLQISRISWFKSSSSLQQHFGICPNSVYNS